MVRVKICGITREEDLNAAIASGADAVGFIVGFPASPRNLTLERAGRLIQTVPPFVDAVLVATLNTIKENLAMVKHAGPDAIQLYTDVVAPEGLRESLDARLIRAYLLKSPDTKDAIRAARGFDALLTDTYVFGREGGTGKLSDLMVCSEIRSAIAPVQMILSGGLTPENVAAAVSKVRPFAVDVSSGVEESPGIKDHRKVAEFVRNAKGAI